MFNQRTRTVIFRVTEDEYQRLKSASIASGARNLSDYTRGLLSVAEDTPLTAVIQDGLSGVHRKLDALMGVMQGLSLRASSPPPGGEPGGPSRDAGIVRSAETCS